MPWLIPVATAVAGIGASLYGANKQSQDTKSAQDQNAALTQQQNNSAWTSWLLSKGVQPTTPVAAGTMPTAGNSTAVNTRLPLWANVQLPAPRVAPGTPMQGVPQFVRKTG